MVQPEYDLLFEQRSDFLTEISKRKILYVDPDDVLENMIFSLEGPCFTRPTKFMAADCLRYIEASPSG